MQRRGADRGAPVPQILEFPLRRRSYASGADRGIMPQIMDEIIRARRCATSGGRRGSAVAVHRQGLDYGGADRGLFGGRDALFALALTAVSARGLRGGPESPGGFTPW